MFTLFAIFSAIHSIMPRGKHCQCNSRLFKFEGNKSGTINVAVSQRFACELLNPVLDIIRLLPQGVILNRTAYTGMPIYRHTLSPNKKVAA